MLIPRRRPSRRALVADREHVARLYTDTLALLEAERWARRAWEERAEAAVASARDAALTEAWLAIRAVAGPWPHDLKEALDAVAALRKGEKPAPGWSDPKPWRYPRSGERTAHKLPQTTAEYRPRTREQFEAAAEVDCCTDGHAEAGGTDD